MAGNSTAVIFGEVFGKVLDTVSKPSVPVDPGNEREVAKAVTEKIAPIVVNATNNEPWYQSRVILGALVAIVGSILGAFGIVLDDDTRNQIIVLIPTVISTFGAIYALYGRIFGGTKKPLGS